MNKQTLIDWAISILIAVILFIIITGLVHLGKVSGESMYPTYNNNERVVVQRKFYNINRGDVITFWADKRDLSPQPKGFFSNIFENFSEIVYRQPDLSTKELHIKRVVGIPGDNVKVETVDNGDSPTLKETNVYVNDELVATSQEEISGPGQSCDDGADCDIELGEDEYFVIGDNYDNSFDSRKHGAIKEEDIFGKVINGKENTNEIKGSQE